MKHTSALRSTPVFAAFGLAVLLLLSGLTGCLAVAAGAGAGAVAYVGGKLDATLTYDFNRSVGATREAIKDLEFAKVSEKKDAYSAVLIARTALDKKVQITLTNTGKNLTNIEIRVGIFGDHKLSMAILDKIKAGL